MDKILRTKTGVYLCYTFRTQSPVCRFREPDFFDRAAWFIGIAVILTFPRTDPGSISFEENPWLKRTILALHA